MAQFRGLFGFTVLMLLLVATYAVALASADKDNSHNMMRQPDLGRPDIKWKQMQGFPKTAKKRSMSSSSKSSSSASSDGAGNGGGNGGGVTAGVQSVVGINGIGVTGTSTAVEVGIADGGVTSARLASDAVTTDKILDGTIATADLADNAVDVNKLGPNSVTSAKIVDGTILTADLSNNVIDAAKLADSSVDSAAILTSAVTTAKIADLAVTTAKINDLAINNAKLGSFAVTEGKINSNAVTNPKIQDGAVTGAKLADGAVGAVKLGDSAVTTNKILNGAVIRSKIADNAINSDKIANDAVGTTEILNGAITNAKLASSSITLQPGNTGVAFTPSNGVVNLGGSITITPTGLVSSAGYVVCPNTYSAASTTIDDTDEFLPVSGDCPQTSTGVDSAAVTFDNSGNTQGIVLQPGVWLVHYRYSAQNVRLQVTPSASAALTIEDASASQTVFSGSYPVNVATATTARVSFAREATGTYALAHVRLTVVRLAAV